jgi:hypothetical protein
MKKQAPRHYRAADLSVGVSLLIGCAILWIFWDTGQATVVTGVVTLAFGALIGAYNSFLLRQEKARVGRYGLRPAAVARLVIINRIANALMIVSGVVAVGVGILVQIPGVLPPSAERGAQATAVLAALAGLGIALGKLLSPLLLPAVFVVVNRFAGDWWDVHRPGWWSSYLERERAKQRAKVEGRDSRDPPAPAA